MERHRRPRTRTGSVEEIVVDKGTPRRRDFFEPSPDEMPAIDHSLMNDVSIGEGADDSDRRGGGSALKGRSISAAAARHAHRIGSEIEAMNRTHSPFTDKDLPSPELLTPPPPRNGGRREARSWTRWVRSSWTRFAHVPRPRGGLSSANDWTGGDAIRVAPAQGGKVRQIANLRQNDLALAMRAEHSRSSRRSREGRGWWCRSAGNPTPEIVAFRGLIESRDFKNAKAALPIALGKLSGRPSSPIRRMPHLLIAGADWLERGKSVCR